MDQSQHQYQRQFKPSFHSNLDQQSSSEDAFTCSIFKQLLDNQLLVDCTLACDGGKISAHKFVLSKCSNYLEKILESNPQTHPVIVLPELCVADLQTLVNYMYTGNLIGPLSSSPSSCSSSNSLALAARVLNINSLLDCMIESRYCLKGTTMTQQTASSSNNINNEIIDNKLCSDNNSIMIGSGNSSMSQSGSNSSSNSIGIGSQCYNPINSITACNANVDDDEDDGNRKDVIHNIGSNIW